MEIEETFTLKAYTKIKFYSGDSTEEEMLWQFSEFMGIHSQSCLVEKQRWYQAIKIYTYIVKKNCLPLHLSSLLSIISTSCSAGRPYTITWRCHRVFHGEKNYVQRDGAVNSDASRAAQQLCVTTEKLFYTSHALFITGSNANPSGAQAGLLRPLTFICHNPWGIGLLWLRSLPTQSFRRSFWRTPCHELKHTAAFPSEQWFSTHGD